MSEKKPPCLHLDVVRWNEEHDETGSQPSGWFCQRCHAEFIPAQGLPSIPELDPEPLNTMLDAIAGTMSAVLWDFHERAIEKYGIPVAPETEEERECHHSTRNDKGTCINCGHSPFLGGE